MQENIKDEANANFNELRRRGITNDVIASFSIQYSESLPFAFKHGLVLPIFNPDGTLSFNKYRRSYLNNDIKQKYAYDLGGHITLYGADHLTHEHTTVVITEGEMDALVLWSKNIPAVTSTGGAMSFQKNFLSFVGDKKVYICYDNDEAGAQGMVRTLEMIPEAYVILLPKLYNTKDISDFCSAGGDFEKLMQNAKQYKSLQEVHSDMNLRASQFLLIEFHKAYIEKNTPVVHRQESGKPSYTGDDAFLKAKSYPCTNLLEFSRLNTLCLWHNDSTPSLHYYPKHNTCYCHSCGKYADSLDIYMKIHSVGMREAIRSINILI